MYPWRTLTVPDGARALLIRDGRLERILTPGRHRWLDWRGRTRTAVYTVNVARLVADWAQVLETDHAELRDAHFVRVRPRPRTLALVTVNGRPDVIIRPGDSALFWRAAGEVEVEIIDLEAGLAVDPVTRDLWQSTAASLMAVRLIAPNETGLLIVDGDLTAVLGPGRHAFWTADRLVEMKVCDRRDQILEVTAQEILTKDRVSIRVTLTAVYAVADPEALYAATVDADALMYRAAQVAIREAVGGRTLDVILRERHLVDAAVDEAVRVAMTEAGVAVREVRVKDVILPGEMRDILNRVVEAEKAAEANVIRRREETAATRALLNTARLMDDNPTLMRLKELETVERLTEKVGHIELRQHADGAGLTSLVDTLLGRNGA